MMDKGEDNRVEDVIQCKNGNSTSRYDAENRYIGGITDYGNGFRLRYPE